MGLVSESDRQPIQLDIVEFDSHTRQFVIRDYWHRVDAADNYMWSLPAQFLGNKVPTFFYRSSMFIGLQFRCLF